jgi:putative membrane protein
MFGWMHWFPFGWFGGMGFFGLIAVIVVVIVLATRGSRHHMRDERRAPSHAEDILKERLARGEIDEETYEKLLSKIK